MVCYSGGIHRGKTYYAEIYRSAIRSRTVQLEKPSIGLQSVVGFGWFYKSVLRNFIRSEDWLNLFPIYLVI